MNEPLEIEVKYLLYDITAIRNKILNAGWTSLGRNFESNIRFEDPENGLNEKKQLLRLRQDCKTTLTFKSHVPLENPRYKILKELEVEVSCFHTMRSILTALGFHEEQVYEKWRETFQADNALICLDQMPFADFIEIEGETNDIDSISQHLGFAPSQAITANYLEIFSHIKNMENLDFTDVTFKNFQGVTGDFIKHIRTFEATSIS